MVVKFNKGVSGYLFGRPYRYSAGSVEVVDDVIGRDHIKAGNAELYTDKSGRPVAEAPEKMAITPTIKRSKVVKAVVKRGR